MSLMSSHRLSLITRHADTELARIHDTIEHKVLVDGRQDVEAVLSTLAAQNEPVVLKTLDLIGHSTPGSSLLQLGDWVIDASSPIVTSFFRELADNDVLPRLGIHAVRLLACNTTATAQARATICALSDILGLEVYGTTGLLYSAHYNERGFSDDWKFLLVASSDIRRLATEITRHPRAAADPRSLDVDALPAVTLESSRPTWPRRIANDRAARNILRLIRRDQGAQMPGLLTTPACEIALPAAQEGLYHLAQVVLDGEFLRVYPDTTSRTGVLYPVAQPQTLRTLVEQLPAAS
ncbi:MAG: hypothetical protein M4D80_16780 [Myxococcota bacterium]|nr:hypothetical protein [Myxococcota bacterium]